ncbi:MAG: hypothetical protein ACJ75F_02455 [Flavisolibacter sp.]
MRLPFFIICLLLASHINAQKEAYDLISFAPPQGWKKEAKENVISYSITNNTTGSWCQIGVFKSTISKGSIAEDFESEWQELVIKTYKEVKPPETSQVEEMDRWKTQSGTASFVFNNKPAIVMLTTASGYNRCMSIIILTNSQDYLSQIETLLASVELVKPLSTQTSKDNDIVSIIGSWGMTASDSSDYRMKNGVMNYIRRQYVFHDDGSYEFVTKAYDPQMDKIFLGKETGTFLVNGNSLTVTPQKSVLEAWTKKDGSDKWGKLLNTQNVQLEKCNYHFTRHYFSGVQEWNLVLQGDVATKRDGPFSNNNVFTNAWYYKPINTGDQFIELPAGQKMETGQAKNEGVQAGNKQFSFSTTNFDDGWTSVVKDDWVQVSKSNLQVLIHYPNKKADDYNPDLLEGLKNAWRTLVAPRYIGDNIEFKPIYSWQSIEYARANMVEKATGKKLHVVLFKVNGLNQTYMEFIAPDQSTFEQEFGSYHETTSGWEKMVQMENYNKFALAAADLQGKWTNNFTGIVQYVNANTGYDAGMNTHASNEKFEIGPGDTYKWEVNVASGMVGNIKFQSAKSAGRYSVPNNWQVSFSDIEGKPRIYKAHFSCIKGLRILWLDDTAFAKVE